MIVVRLFLAVPRLFLQFVIVVFPDHTHYFGSLVDKIHHKSIPNPFQIFNVAYFLSTVNSEIFALLATLKMRDYDTICLHH